MLAAGTSRRVSHAMAFPVINTTQYMPGDRLKTSYIACTSNYMADGICTMDLTLQNLTLPTNTLHTA